jgi:hypothetical protein
VALAQGEPQHPAGWGAPDLPDCGSL